MRRLPLILATSVVLAACGRDGAEPAATATPAPTATAAATATAPAREHRFDAAIDADDYAAHLRTLSSDEFEGRGPGAIGERMTTTYLKAEFERLGLAPGNGDSYFQSVPMVETRVDPATTLSIATAGEPMTLRFGDDMVIGTRSAKTQVTIDGSELVFAGYGVVAPEYGWNDYEGLDVKGKTVVLLINDPGFIRKDPELFKGKAMTYYGRWTYKFEEAARQGATGALIVHETEAAAYGWDVVRNSWSGAQFDLPPSEDTDPRLSYEGWITGDVAKRLFAAAGLDLEQQRLAADQRGFKALPLKAKASAAITSTVRNASSDNVLAKLPGTTKADEAVVFVAHWDHLGRSFGSPTGDNIYNGAVDNASGLAALLEIAEAFARAPEKPARTVLFLAVTLEESGLLGSRYYVAHPVIPLERTVAAINMDAMTLGPRSKDVTVIGYGQSDLEDALAAALKAQDRVIAPELTPEKGFYFRSDQFNFARRGVPALYAKGGFDWREGGTQAGLASAEDYTANRYHKPSDHFDPAWDFAGVIEDVQALYEVGRRVASGELTPQWREGSEFKSARSAPAAAAAD